MIKKRDITNLSDLDQTQWANVQFAGIRRQFPSTLASQIKGVQPITQPQGIYFALRYLYANNHTYGMKCPFEKDKNTPQLNLKYRKKIQLYAITPKNFLSPTYWSANPGKNEKFHVKVYK